LKSSAICLAKLLPCSRLKLMLLLWAV